MRAAALSRGLPTRSPLTEEAVDQAVATDFEGVPFRVVRADHLAAIALSVGRAKDLARILALLESGSVSREGLESLAARVVGQFEISRR